MQHRKIQYFDSMGGDGRYYLNAILQYLKDEWASKHDGEELPFSSLWELVSTNSDVPQQKNTYDCGVFTCMFADFLSLDYPLLFTQEHIDRVRQRIALSILKGYIDW